MPEVLIPAGASLIGGFMQSEATSDAADIQGQSAAAAIAEQRRQFDQTRQDYAPYRQAGQQALGQLAGELDRMPTPQEVMGQPGYQFGLDQGMQAMQRRTAAMGGRVSGQALKAASRYGTDYATTGYNAEYQRRQDRLNRLASLAGIGQPATGASAQAGQSMANNVGAATIGAGDAAGASRVAQGNIWGNQGNQLAALYMRNQQPRYGGGASFGSNLDGFFRNGSSGD